MPLRKYRDWNRLVGVPVEIRQYGRTIRAGIVDDVMPDSSLLWLMADSTQGRALFNAREDYEVWLELDLLETHHLLQVAAPV